jgi:hypothetical protein
MGKRLAMPAGFNDLPTYRKESPFANTAELYYIEGLIMRPKQLATLLLTLCTYATAFADTFTVTSTADEGAGSLREAITKANSNGIAVTDYIYFNIPEPEFNKRVIRLKTQLPALTSNIVIDGTTQPGERYAITDAKICILTDEPLPEFSMLRIENASHVKIYGLYLYYGYWRGFFGSPYRSELLYGVNLIKSNAIEIGAPGKGNVINGVVTWHLFQFGFLPECGHP